MKESLRRSLLPDESEPFISQRWFCFPSPIWRDEVWSRSLELSIKLNLLSDIKVWTTKATTKQRCWTLVAKQNFFRESDGSKSNLKLNLPGTWNWGVEDLPCAPQKSEKGLQAVVPIGCWLLWDASLCQGMWTFPHTHAHPGRLSPDQESTSVVCKQNTEQRNLQAK